MKSSLGDAIKIFCAAFFWMLCTHLCAQTLRGTVVAKETGKPLKSATVMLLGNSNQTTLAFTRTASDGKFSIQVPNGKVACSLLFSSLGYAKDTVDARIFRQGQTIRLLEQTQTIREISIKAPRVGQHGDTLDYLVSNFRQKQDRSIADVINKMPGMQVNKDGSIMYQGRPINKFYIEGLDLLGGKYSQASENLSANQVKKVQVFQNHQPVRMLRDMSISEQAALNIVLNDSAKNVWQGMADVASGAAVQGNGGWLCDSRLTAMLFSREKQSISMYKYNNTGKNILNELGEKQVLENQVPTENGLLENISLPELLLDDNRTMLNDSHVLSSNWLFKTKGGNDIRVQLSGMFDDTEQHRTTHTIYSDVEGSTVVAEDVSAHSYRRELSGEMLYKINKDKFYLTNTIKGYADFNQSSGLSILNGQNKEENVKPRKRFFSDTFSMIHKQNNGRICSVNAYLSYNTLPSTLLLTDNTWQRLHIESAYWGASSYLQHVLGPFNMKYTLEEKGKSQRMQTNSNVSMQTDHLTENKVSLTPELNYKGTSIQLRVGLPLSWLARSYHADNQSDLLIEPLASLVVTPNAYWRSTVSYQYVLSPFELYEMSSASVFTDYINMRQGTGCLDASKTHTVSLYTSYKHAVSGFFASLMGNWFSSCGNVLYKSSLVDGIYHSMATDLRSSTHGINAIGRVAKSFRCPQTSVGFSIFYNSSDYKLLLADEATPFNLTVLTLSADFSMQLSDWFSVEAKSALTASKQQNKQNSSESPSALCSFSHHVNVYFMPNSWRMEWKNELYHSSDKGVSPSFFSDISVSYQSKTYEIGVSLNNILGKNVYERRYLTNTQQQYTISQLRPRELMAKLAFNF